MYFELENCDIFFDSKIFFYFKKQKIVFKNHFQAQFFNKTSIVSRDKAVRHIIFKNIFNK